MRSEISFDHHSFQNDPGMTVFCHSDLILSFETKDERNEVDKVPFRKQIPKLVFGVGAVPSKFFQITEDTMAMEEQLK